VVAVDDPRRGEEAEQAAVETGPEAVAVDDGDLVAAHEAGEAQKGASAQAARRQLDEMVRGDEPLVGGEVRLLPGGGDEQLQGGAGVGGQQAQDLRAAAGIGAGGEVQDA